MNVVGKTTEGVEVVSDVGKLYFQQGLPLSIIFDELKKNDMMPSWNHLYQELVDNGMKHSRVIHLLNEQLFESYGKEFRDEVINKLEKTKQ